jgi:hypothetical protein
VQHALRAFTEKDRKAIKKAAENFPITKYYDTAETLTSLGIGEALVTALDEKGIPTPLAAVRLKAPESRIGTITEAEMSTQLKDSRLLDKYQTVINRESAYEILTKKILAKDEVTVSEVKKTGSREEPSLIESVSSNPLMKQIGRTVARELTRGLLGALGFKTSSGRKRSLF